MDRFRSIEFNPISLRDPVPPINTISLDKMNSIWENLLKQLLTEQYFLEFKVDKEQSIMNFDRMIPKLPESRSPHYIKNLSVSPFNFINSNNVSSIGIFLIGEVTSGCKCYQFLSVFQVLDTDKVLRKRILFDETFNINRDAYFLLPKFLTDVLSVEEDIDKKNSIGIFEDDLEQDPNPWEGVSYAVRKEQ